MFTLSVGARWGWPHAITAHTILVHLMSETTARAAAPSRGLDPAALNVSGRVAFRLAERFAWRVLGIMDRGAGWTMTPPDVAGTLTDILRGEPLE